MTPASVLPLSLSLSLYSQFIMTPVDDRHLEQV